MIIFVFAVWQCFQDKHNIHFTYIGTGCIYNYDDTHTITENGFKKKINLISLDLIIALLKVLQMN